MASAPERLLKRVYYAPISARKVAETALALSAISADEEPSRTAAMRSVVRSYMDQTTAEILQSRQRMPDPAAGLVPRAASAFSNQEQDDLEAYVGCVA